MAEKLFRGDANIVGHAELVAEYLKLFDMYREKAVKIEVCPVCGHKHLVKFLRDVVRLDHLSTCYLSDDYLLCCNRCGLVMVDRVYPVDYYHHYINRFYGVPPTDTYVAEYSMSKAEQRCEILKRSGVCTDDVLEVSSFDGVTLDMLQRQFGSNVIGFEPTKSATDFAVKHFPDLKGRVYNDCFERYSEHGVDKKFDAVLFSYCFRAVSDPDAALTLLQEIVKPGGVVVVDEGFLMEDFLLFHEIETVKRRIYSYKLFYYGLHNLIYLFERYGFTYNFFVRSDFGFNYMAAILTNTGKKRKSGDRLVLARLATENATRVYQYLNEETASPIPVVNPEKYECPKVDCMKDLPRNNAPGDI